MKKVISILLTLTLVFGLYVPTVSAATTTSVAPVIHLTFDGDLKDSSGNGYNGSAPDANITYMDGVIGKAAKVDSAMISLIGSSAITLNKEFSFSAWVKMDPDVVSSDILTRPSADVSVDNQLLITSGYGDTAIGILTAMQDATDATYVQKEDFGSSTFIQPEQNKDRFMHVAIVYNGTVLKIYLDGKLDSSENIDTSYINGTFFGNGKDFIVGGLSADTFFHGYMDDLLFFDKAIPFTDITALYSAGVKTAKNKMVIKVYDPNMMVNGVKKEIDPGKGTTPIINAQGRTILPIRAVIEEMGGKIDGWDPVAKCATLSYNGNIIKLWINKDKAEVNGVLKEIDPGKGVVPELVNNRTLLPIRFILKELGLPELLWDGNLQTITLQY